MSHRIAAAAVTFLVYLPAAGHDFVNFDDPPCVTGNEFVRGGLTLAGLRWACTALDYGNRHPLTWLSLMLTVQFIGLHPLRVESVAWGPERKDLLSSHERAEEATAPFQQALPLNPVLGR